MPPYVAVGLTYAFAAAVQPGPYQAYLVSEALSHGWRRTLPAAVAPLLSDAPIIALVLLALSRLPPGLEVALRLGGGAFLLFLAWRALGAWRRYGVGVEAGTPPAHRGLIRAAAVNFLNPNPWLGWSLVMGPLLLRAWREGAGDAVLLLAAFYGTMVVASAGIIALFAGARGLGPRVARTLVGVSALALAAFGCWQLGSGTAALLRG